MIHKYKIRWILKRLQQIANIKKEKLRYFDEKNIFDLWEKTRKEFPDNLIDVYNLDGLDINMQRYLYNKYNISTENALVKLLTKGGYWNLPGSGGKSLENQLLRFQQMIYPINGKILLITAHYYSKQIIDDLIICEEVERIEIVGSIRRKENLHHDIDLLIASIYPEKVMDIISSLLQVSRILETSKYRIRVLLVNQILVDFRIVSPENFEKYLHIYTGNLQHVAKLKEFAGRTGAKLYENIKKEKDIYEKLGIPYIYPPLREGEDEIQKAIENDAFRLVNIGDIKGDLHLHTQYSDGKNTVEEVVDEARKLGYEYIAITDHSYSDFFKDGITEEKLDEQIDLIRKLNKKYKDIKILTGCELDILEDGSLPYSNNTLEKLDIVIASLHCPLDHNKNKITERVVKALENGKVDILAHPTSKKLLGSPFSYEIDMDAVFNIVIKTGTAVEINAFPDRDDLNYELVRKGKERGVKFVINSDAHNTSRLKYLFVGVATAQRGRLSKEDVINTLNLEKLFRFLKRRRKLT